MRKEQKRMSQNQPYLPISCEEFSMFQGDETEEWPNQKLRLLGKLMKDDDPKVIKRQEKSKFETHSKVILESVGEKCLNKIPLDFSLIPEKLTNFEHGDTVQIYGECSKCDGLVQSTF